MGNWCHQHRLPLLPKICDALIRLIHNCAVYSASEIGTGTIFGYGGIGVIIHPKARIGKQCVIGSNVTVGGKSHSESAPIIGNRVYLATGAKILGDIKIGDNCVIGANAVVVKDVPPNCVAAGVPAKIIAQNIEPKDYY